MTIGGEIESCSKFGLEHGLAHGSFFRPPIMHKKWGDVCMPSATHDFLPLGFGTLFGAAPEQGLGVGSQQPKHSDLGHCSQRTQSAGRSQAL